MKKRLLFYAFATIIAVFFATAVCALTLEDTDSVSEKDVFAKMELISEADTVYYVDISWGDMEFNYNAGKVTKTWNPSTHAYEETVVSAENTWSCATGADMITVTNRSNKALEAVVSAEINEEYSGISVHIDSERISLADASIGATLTESGTPSTGSAKITLSGELTNKNASKTEIGNVIITIADAE